jgi:hypothetical protein
VRLALAPLDQVVHRPRQVLEEADEDVFLGLEVVVERRLRDVQPFGDLPQRRLLVALLGEEFEATSWMR